MEANFQKFIGLKWGEDVTKKDIMAIEGVEEIRVLYPNSAMTLDLRRERANIHLLEDRTIVEITMG